MTAHAASTTNSHGELVLTTMSDAEGWTLPQYYVTPRLISLPGRPGKVLAVRGGSGLVLFALTPGQGPVRGFPAGQWTQLTQGGPFADADCFSDGKCWNVAPYYQTIRYGDIDGEPGDEVPLAGDANAHQASDYLSMRFGDIDGEPGQELLQWNNGEGVVALKFVSGQGGGAWKELFTAGGVWSAMRPR